MRSKTSPGASHQLCAECFKLTVKPSDMYPASARHDYWWRRGTRTTRLAISRNSPTYNIHMAMVGSRLLEKGAPACGGPIKERHTHGYNRYQYQSTQVHGRWNNDVTKSCHVLHHSLHPKRGSTLVGPANRRGPSMMLVCP
jgi:hypothetical protein